MIVDGVQRWTERRASRRPAGELIRTSAYDVEPIASSVEARDFVSRHHYAASASSPAHRYGLYRRGDLVGVALFGPPASMNAHRSVFPTLTPREAVTLGRLVLLDQVPGNGESWFLARCFEQLGAKGIVAIESCADPVPRTTASGSIVHRGHIGTIYCATNGHYVGRTNPSTLRLLPDGSCYSNRSSSKVAQGDIGSPISWPPPCISRGRSHRPRIAVAGVARSSPPPGTRDPARGVSDRGSRRVASPRHPRRCAHG